MKYFYLMVLSTLILSCEDVTFKDEPLPKFDLMLQDSSIFNTATIPVGSPIVTMYYSGSCDECHEEVKEIVKHMDKLKNVRFVLITLEPVTEIKHFSEFLHLGKYDNILIGKDTAKFFPRYLRATTTPYMVLWDKNKMMKGLYPSRPPVDTLISHINALEKTQS